MLERERERVAAAARRLADERLVLGTAGNISERCENLIAITPTGAVLADLRAEQVTVVDVAGDHVAGEFAASSELGLHLGIYRRFGAGAVVHTHPPIGTALACVLDEVPVVHYCMLAFGGPVRVAPYATFGSPELAELALDALDKRSVALMSNHGAVAHAPDLDAAVEQAVLLEWACTVYWHAAAIGAPRTLDDEQRDAFASAVRQRGYGTQRRIER